MFRIKRLVAMATMALPLLFATSTAWAEADTAKTYTYVINHSEHGDIGTFTNKIVRDGNGGVTVDTKLRIAVKVLFIVVYRETADRREVYKNGRMMAYDGTTTISDDSIKIKGRATDAGFVITGEKGAVTAPAGVMTTNPWSMNIIKATTLMSTKTGTLDKVKVVGGETQSIEIGSGTIRAKHYRITGDMTRDLWFDGKGALAKFQFVRDDATITFTRQ